MKLSSLARIAALGAAAACFALRGWAADAPETDRELPSASPTAETEVRADAPVDVTETNQETLEAKPDEQPTDRPSPLAGATETNRELRAAKPKSQGESLPSPPAIETNREPAAAKPRELTEARPSRRGGAAEPAAKGRPSFEAFKLIADRNIFNPSRRPRSARGPAPERPKPVRVDTLALVGTLSYEKGYFAFFDGSSSEYRKVLKVAERIGGWQVAAVLPDRVRLAAAKQALELRVGARLRREDGGEWRLSADSDSPAVASEPASSSASADASAGGGESEILKRLLQKREKELDK